MEGIAADYAEFWSAENGNFNNGVDFTVEDLLDFNIEEFVTMTDPFFEPLPGNSSTVPAVDGQFNGNINSRSYNEPQFSGNELCVPYDDLAELEWLANFVEESFSTDVLGGPRPEMPPLRVGEDATGSSN